MRLEVLENSPTGFKPLLTLLTTKLETLQQETLPTFSDVSVGPKALPRSPAVIVRQSLGRTGSPSRTERHTSPESTTNLRRFNNRLPNEIVWTKSWSNKLKKKHNIILSNVYHASPK